VFIYIIKIFYFRVIHKPLFGGINHAEVSIENKKFEINLNTKEFLNLPYSGKINKFKSINLIKWKFKFKIY
jgi:hypothetical protein